MTLSTKQKTVIACLALVGCGLGHAQTGPTPSTVQTQSLEQLKNRENIYHGELLSEQERNAYLERLRLAKTEQEREQIRLEHREKMDLRLRALNQNKAEAEVAAKATRVQLMIFGNRHYSTPVARKAASTKSAEKWPKR